MIAVSVTSRIVLVFLFVYCTVAADIHARDYAGKEPKDVVKASVSQDVKGLWYGKRGDVKSWLICLFVIDMLGWKGLCVLHDGN